MKQPVRYYWGTDHLRILLGNRTDPRIKMLYYIEFVVLIGMATIMLFRAFSLEGDWLHLVAGSGILLLYALAGYRFLSRMLFREELSVSSAGITHIVSTPFSSRRRSFSWEKMGSLHYRGHEEKTDHPLKGGCFDYFGFDTQERLIQNLHHDGNLSFRYGDEEIRFARGIYSWHAEDLIRMIRLYAGNALVLGDEWKDLMREMNWQKGD